MARFTERRRWAEQWRRRHVLSSAESRRQRQTAPSFQDAMTLEASPPVPKVTAPHGEPSRRGL